VVKKRFSGFHATTLAAELASRGTTRLVLAGVQTPNCIRATAFDALSGSTDFAGGVVVLSDATASATPFVQESNLYDLRCAGAEVLPTAEWVASLGGAAGAGGSGDGASGSGA
jgi:nicotinamidase-related amidase